MARGGAVIIEERVLGRLGVGVVVPRAGVPVVASTATATEGFRFVEELEATLVVIGSSADSTVRHAVRRAAALQVGIVVFLEAGDVGAVLELCALGAHAVLTRDATEDELSMAITHAVRREHYVPQRLLGRMLGARRAHRPTQRLRVALTKRETAVLIELVAGRTNQEIAERLCIGTETVKTHLGNIYAKLAVRRRHEAVGVALQLGLV